MTTPAHTDTPPTYNHSLLYSRATRYPRPRTRDPPTPPTTPQYSGFIARNHRSHEFSSSKRGVAPLAIPILIFAYILLLLAYVILEVVL